MIINNPIVQVVLTICCSVVASSGFWACISAKANRNDVKSEMLMGLAHDRILYLGMKYIERGYITNDEYENLVCYLYEPYVKLLGNGSAERVVKECKTLPIVAHVKGDDLSGV